MREYINGVGIYPFASSEELLSYVLANPNILVAVNAEKILHATDETRAIINSGIGYCDGVGAVWAMHKRGHRQCVKIAGCELWLDIIRSTYRDKTFYLIGGKPSVIEETVDKLKAEFDGIQIVAYRDGYIKSEEEQARLIADVQAKRPDVVFVAMGSPKQEYLMQKMLSCHKATYQGLGGSFDVYVGAVERAPKWWIEHNLEFAYRLLKQPSRIKRQIKLVVFAVRMFLDKW